MANTATMENFWSALLDSSDTSQNLILNPDKRYIVTHLQVDGAGVADTNRIRIELSKQLDGAVPDAAVGNLAEDTEAIILDANNPREIIPRGVKSFNYIRITAGAPMLQVVRVDRSPGFTS